MSQALRTIPLIFLAFVCLLTQFATASGKPNGIIVMTDDQGYGDLGCHGNPILKKLAAVGKNMERQKNETL